jgi:hypothetical protein
MPAFYFSTPDQECDWPVFGGIDACIFKIKTALFIGQANS